MRVGFIGTGKIASSVITWICNSKISFKKILVSPRNRNIAQKLKRKFRKVSIAKNNQEIVNACNWVFLAVIPKVGKSKPFWDGRSRISTSIYRENYKSIFNQRRKFRRSSN